MATHIRHTDLGYTLQELIPKYRNKFNLSTNSWTLNSSTKLYNVEISLDSDIYYAEITSLLSSDDNDNIIFSYVYDNTNHKLILSIDEPINCYGYYNGYISAIEPS